MKCFRLVFQGEAVTNVGFRIFLFSVARKLRIENFWAENIDLDKVEVLAKASKEVIDKFIDIVKKNKPERIIINKVDIDEYDGEIPDSKSYYEMLSLEQLSKIVDAGLSLLGKQDEMLKKQDLMLEKQDLMLEKQDRMLELQERTIDEIRNLRYDLKSYMEERFRKIEEDIRRIKEKIGLA